LNVREDALRPDALVTEPAQRPQREAGRGALLLVGQDLGVDEAGGIVDGDVQELPADAATGVPRVAGGPVPGATHDAPQLLGVEVQQVARVLVLVADDRLGLASPTHQPLASQRPVDRRGRHAQPGADDVGTAPGGPAQGHDGGLVPGAEPVRAMVGPGAGVDEPLGTLLAPARQPAIVGVAADPERGAGRGDAHTGLHGLEQLDPVSWRQRGVGMTMHEEPSLVG
jgi:hypothetical protein